MDEKELIDALNYLADSKGYVAFHSEEDMDSVCKNCKADFCYHGKNDAHWCVYSAVQRAAVEIGKLLTRAETAEKENARLKEDLENWSYNCKVMLERAQQFKRERDAALEQLHGYCPACAHYTQNHCNGACAECKHEYYQYRGPKATDNWKWNGGDKEE